MQNRFCVPVALVLVAGAVRAAPSVALDALRYPDAAAAARAWQPREQAAAPRPLSADAPGLAFSCPFGRSDADRFYWDRDVALDLSRCTSIELDLSCARPEAFRSVNLYFESGDGWYVCAAPLRRAGRQSLVFTRNACTTEGRPAGWNRVRRIRLSPWRGAAIDTELRLYGLTGRRDTVVLVRGTASLPNDAERRAAAAVTARLDRWLTDSRIPHGVLDDEEADAKGLADARVILLGYNARLPDAELAALRSAVARGARLVVCYSSDPRLAKLMGFELGDYQTAPPGRPWTAFRFDDPAAYGVPARVLQESGNIRPVRPATAAARVVAWWEDVDGRRTREPAWVVGPAGAWMTHVLQEGDAPAKRALLATLTARYAPELWPRVVDPLIEEAGRIDSYASFTEAVADIRRSCRRDASVRQLLARAAAARAGMKACRDAGDYPAVLNRSRQVRELLSQAYAAAQRPVPGEFRLAWDPRGTGWFPGDWDRTCDLLAKSGLTAIAPCLLRPDVAHYPSKRVPSSLTARVHGDQARACVAAAHRHGLEAHLWTICWALTDTSAAAVARYQRDGRLQVDGRGRTLPWLCPSDPRNVAAELAALREAVTRYAFDGIQLDYIRFPGADACYCPSSRAAFEAQAGRRIEPWPGAVREGGAWHDRYRAWQAGEITRFVARVRAMLREVRPSARLSAAVYGNYPQCASSIGQDWGAWLRGGTVDFVCPMNYTENLARFRSMAEQQLALPGARGRVFPGIGVTANESQLLGDQVVEQVLALRRAGAGGFALFQLDAELRERVLPLLRLGVTADGDTRR